MAFTRSPIFRLVVALTILAIPMSSFAADAVGKATGSGAAIDWQVSSSNYDSVEVTVNSPLGETYVRKFAAGKTPSFRVQDLGADVADGVYTYQLRMTPKVSADLKKKLESARKSGDDAAARKLIRESGLSAPEQSGAFTIRNGSIVASDLTESGNKVTGAREISSEAVKPKLNVVALDQVIPDDLIVQGSGCFGFDCVNNESFGFDTIRLKENNLRIKAEDTSVGSFPTNDWQLTFNDSASGGASKFSVEDITGSRVPMTITAGASTNSIFVDSTGRVGFRTSTPVLDLHVSTGNTPAIRLEQTNASGFTAQTWDIGANEANFFVRDVTGGSKLSFRIRPGAPTSSVDISADGDVGIGTGSPDEKLHVFENVDANTFLVVENPNTGVSAGGFLRAKSDVATLNFQAHGSARTISRFGVTLGGWSELLQVAGGSGDGLAIGTSGANPVILGTNSVARMTIAGTGAITVPGDFTVSGTKNFAVVDPADAKQALYYTALEGPEAGTYYRGSAKTVNGQVVIELPGYFSRLTEKERMTVQITPVGGWGQLYVAEKSPERLVIKVGEGSSELEFDYLVQGVRKGYLDYEVERTGVFPVVNQ
jgi:hypothetical protein